MDLAELILANKGERSYETLSRACGGVPTAGRLQQIAGRGRSLANFPDPPSIRGLARGLGVTELAVVVAAAQTLGLDVDRALPRLVQMLPAGVEFLDEHEVNVVLTMIQTLLAAHRRDAATEAALVHERMRREIADLEGRTPATAGEDVDQPGADGARQRSRDVS